MKTNLQHQTYKIIRYSIKLLSFFITAVLFELNVAYADNGIIGIPGNLWIDCKAALDIQEKRLKYRETGEYSNITLTEAGNAGVCQGYIIATIDNNLDISLSVPTLELVRLYVSYINNHPSLQSFNFSSQPAHLVTAPMIIRMLMKESQGAKCYLNKKFVLCNQV